MLLLCSNGLSCDSLISELRKRAKNCQRAALVVTADPIYKGKNYHVSRAIQELEFLCSTVDIFDLDFQPAELLIQYDIVEFIGGNPYYLLKSIRTANCMDTLRFLAQEKTLIGWSAAAFVFGPTLALADKYTPEMNEYGITDLSGISLTDCLVLPHYSRFIKKFDFFEEICQSFEAENNVKVIRLNDGDGVFLSDNNTEIYRGGSQ